MECCSAGRPLASEETRAAAVSAKTLPAKYGLSDLKINRTKDCQHNILIKTDKSNVNQQSYRQ